MAQLGSIRRKFISGVFFTAAAKYSGLLIQLLVTAFLARLLKPADFGLVAIATILIQFFNTLSEAGVGPAIIQKKSLTRDNYDSIFTFSLIMGVILGSIFYLSSGYIGQFYDNVKLVLISKFLCILILISSVNIVPQNLLLKNEKFKILGIRSVSVQLVTGLISIYMAYSGWGVYSLVFSAIISSGALFLINYCFCPLKLNFDFRCIKSIFSFSVYQFMFNVLNYFARNLDKIMVGKFIGMSQLGYYEKSYRLMILPLNNITFVITPVLHPIFSNFQKDENLIKVKYLKLLHFIGYIAFPLTAFLYFASKELVLLFFGTQWYSSILAFKILSLTTGLQVVNSTSGAIFQSLNFTKGLFYCSLVSSMISFVGLFISIFFWGDIESVAISFDITTVLGICIVYYVLCHRMNVKFYTFINVFKTSFLLMGSEFLVLHCFEIYITPNNLYISLFLKFSIVAVITFTAFVCSHDLCGMSFLKYIGERAKHVLSF